MGTIKTERTGKEASFIRPGALMPTMIRMGQVPQKTMRHIAKGRWSASMKTSARCPGGTLLGRGIQHIKELEGIRLENANRLHRTLKTVRSQQEDLRRYQERMSVLKGLIRLKEPIKETLQCIRYVGSESRVQGKVKEMLDKAETRIKESLDTLERIRSWEMM